MEDYVIDTVEDGTKILNSYQLCREKGWDHQAFVGVLKSLESQGRIKTTTKEISGIELTREGKETLSKGSPEYRTFSLVSNDGIEKSVLMKQPFAKIGFSHCMRLKWLRFDKTNGKVFRQNCKVEDSVQSHLKDIDAGKNYDSSILPDLKKRKLVATFSRKSFTVERGPQFSKEKIDYATNLTSQHLQKDDNGHALWKKAQFKPYNLRAMGVPPSAGGLHPLLKVREEYRNIFLELGFEEMPTNSFVENGFWNFDALFQPQQHPARDAHDTFFLSKPEKSTEFPQEYLARVRNMHEVGGQGSIGWRYNWKMSEAEKNILRTHTTAVSSRMLYQLAQQKEFTPKKYFSIDRVYRNEAVDATHLAEFHQVEGLIADYNLTLGNLIGMLAEFFGKIGIQKLRFKPAYNPYTEPSLEIFSYHEGLKKWVEVGNSGVFRPEMLLPMGLPESVRVIAWGLSLERPTMIKYGISNIRELVGHKIDLDFVRKNPICRIEK